jgi:hypothetical protein
VPATAVALTNGRQIVPRLYHGFEPTEIFVRKVEGLTATV